MPTTPDRRDGLEAPEIPASIYRCEPFDPPAEFSLELPGSKSHANRAIVAACLTDGVTRLENALSCDDTDIITKNLQKLGYDIRVVDADKGIVEIHGGIPTEGGSGLLHFNNAGTPLRLVSSVAALTPGEWTVTGSDRMLQRPIADLVNALRELGVDVEDTAGRLPIRIRGGSMRGGTVNLDASKSSQFLSSLMLVGPQLADGLNVKLKSELTSPGYVELTERVMRDYGVDVKRGEGTFAVDGVYRSPESYKIEGDWSAAGALLALAEIKGSKAVFPNLNPDSLQSDRFVPAMIEQMRAEGDVVLDCTEVPDQVMSLALVAAHRDGTTTFTGAANLRGKECDRLGVLREQLSLIGVDIVEHPDGVIIRGAKNAVYGRAKTGHDIVMDPYDDHRMAMCFAVLGSHHAGISVKDPHCVSKSYPHFFRDLDSLRPANQLGAGVRGKLGEALDQ